jgi:hypothetical protein
MASRFPRSSKMILEERITVEIEGKNPWRYNDNNNNNNNNFEKDVRTCKIYSDGSGNFVGVISWMWWRIFEFIKVERILSSWVIINVLKKSVYNKSVTVLLAV